MDSFVRELRYAFRALSRTPAFSAAAVLALALGIGGSSAIFSVLENVRIALQRKRAHVGVGGAIGDVLPRLVEVLAKLLEPRLILRVARHHPRGYPLFPPCVA